MEHAQNAIATLVRTNLVVPVGKTGKVSKSNEKAASVLQEASALATISAAVLGSGAIKKLAVMQLQGLHTVEYFTSRESIDGGEWADFLTALVARHGSGTFNPATMRGKNGAVAYVKTTIAALELKGAVDGWTDKLQTKLGIAEEDLANVERLVAAAMAAAAVAAPAAS